MLVSSGKSSPYKPKYDWQQNAARLVKSKQKYKLMHSDKGSVNDDYDEIDFTKSEKGEAGSICKQF